MREGLITYAALLLCPLMMILCIVLMRGHKKPDNDPSAALTPEQAQARIVELQKEELALRAQLDTANGERRSDAKSAHPSPREADGATR